MPALLPRRRPDLVVRQVAPDDYVIKQPRTGTYFQFGEVEHFLLQRLDGSQTADELRAAFQAEYGDELAHEELEEFLTMLRTRGLLQVEDAGTGTEVVERPHPAVGVDEDDEALPSGPKQNWMFWRKNLFDPDRLFNRLEPCLRWVWTPAFVTVSSCTMLLALLVLWGDRHHLVASFPEAMRWETVLLVWFTIAVVTTLHEFAHGLTCKHFGGEVHEVGLLVAFFTPCFFCNVSDAWLIPQKSRRVWVTLAGGYCDLCVWALAVFVWRLTVLDSLVNYIASVVLSICGTRVFFNFNPLLRMDGYYILSDLLSMPNLRKRSQDYWMQHIRWLLWGAARPERVPYGWVLFGYGVTTWGFALIFLDFLVFAVFHFLGGKVGVLGLAIALLLMTIALRRVFKGFFASEFMTMITTRPVRTCCWTLVLLGVPAALCTIEMKSTSTGNFEIRPGTRVEVHSPIAGFLKTISVEEGTRVEPGTVIAELNVPDLTSLIVRKQAEMRESQALLAKLRMGPRPEEVHDQRERIQRAEAWRDLAQKDLERARIGLKQDLLRMDQEIVQFETELAFARNTLKQADRLFSLGAIAGEQLRSERKKLTLLQSQITQSQAQKSSREAEGSRAAEAELARRQKELEDAKAALNLLQAGSRPEEIEAELARAARLDEEYAFLRKEEEKLQILAPAAGVISTPRMQEKLGQLADKGALICVVEDLATLDAEILIAEDQVDGLQPGQTIELKARALPFDTFIAVVDRIAPSAVGGLDKLQQQQSTVVIHCKVENPDGQLKSGMTGFARIHRGKKPVASVIGNKGLRYLRTEFWW